MKVLLIDDCLDTGNLVKQGLFPIEVTHSLSIAEAHTVLKSTKFDLILIDVTLPDGDGFTFCRELSKNPLLASTPLILLTAKDELADKVFGFNCGASDYITKPFHIPELQARVNAHLRITKRIDDLSLKSKYF